MTIGLDHPVVTGTASLLGIEPGPAVSVLTVFSVVAYIVCFAILTEVALQMMVAYRKATGLEAFILFFFAFGFGLLLFILDVIHTLLLIWFGYSALKRTRDWWHEGK